MHIPQFFDRTTFKNIPTDPGIYAFFLDFEFIIRTIKARSTPTTDLTPFIDKAVRAHTTSNPNSLELKLVPRKSFTSVLELQPTHFIRHEPLATAPTAAEARTIAEVLNKCTLFAGPLYIGITDKQTLYKRFRQHRAKFERHKKQVSAGGVTVKGRDMYLRSGKFYHRLVRRKVEFRDLVFACIPLTTAELAHVDYVEKVLHCLAAPALSHAH